MNIDISNAHCGPRILFLDHSWLRVVSISKTARFSGSPSPPGRLSSGERRSEMDARRVALRATRRLEPRQRAPRNLAFPKRRRLGVMRGPPPVFRHGSGGHGRRPVRQVGTGDDRARSSCPRARLLCRTERLVEERDSMRALFPGRTAVGSQTGVPPRRAALRSPESQT